MNYRHAFHAGNFADCMKHALLVWLLRAMTRKDAPFLVFDTHAGIGRYDLAKGPAERTGEWRQGIARLLEDVPDELADYLDVVRRLGLYPGSPAIARALLRPQDRLVLCELHGEDNLTLRHLFGRDPQVAVHKRDAWEALGALLPPRERRGLVLIDPPYEAADEFTRLVAGLQTGLGRFANGVFAAWYPIKHRTPVRALHDAIRASGIRDVVAAELCLREPTDPARLNGCGLLVVNPPYQFEAEAALTLAALLARLGDREPGEAAAVLRLADE
jgi:23S rRNA (adenine2030-N6)-methyltransferase